MTPPSSADLTALQWVAFGDEVLRGRGCDPDDRVHYTGHTRMLDPTWVVSIGMWTSYDRDDFIDTKAPHAGRVKVTFDAYRQFKRRHGLMTRRDFVRAHGPEPWRAADLAYRAYHRKRLVMLGRNGVEASFGQTCRLVHVDGRHRAAEPAMRLGMLPVEIGLYVRLFDAFLGDQRYDDWDALSNEDKTITWVADTTLETPWAVGSWILSQPAIRSLAVRDSPTQAVG